MLRVAALLLGGAVVATLPAGASTEAAAPRVAFVLLRDGRAVQITVPRGPIRVRRLAGRRPLIQSGPLLAYDPLRQVVYVLLERAVAVVDARTLAVRRRIRLPAGLRYRGLALGPASGRLYVAANREVRVLDRSTGLAEEDAVVVTIDLRSGRALAPQTVREAVGKSWYVAWTALSQDERRLVLAYHGGCDGAFRTCTTGADVVAIDDERVGRCVPPSGTRPSEGCSAIVHGRVDADGAGFLAATGSAELVRLDDRGVVSGRLDSRLERNHVMDFALDRAGRAVYVAGSCVRAAPGLNVVSLETGAARILVSPAARRPVCAERLAVAAGPLLALATRRSAFYPGFRDALVLVNGRSGRRLREVRLGSEPLDLVMPP